MLNSTEMSPLEPNHEPTSEATESRSGLEHWLAVAEEYIGTYMFETAVSLGQEFQCPSEKSQFGNSGFFILSGILPYFELFSAMSQVGENQKNCLKPGGGGGSSKAFYDGFSRIAAQVDLGVAPGNTHVAQLLFNEFRSGLGHLCFIKSCSISRNIDKPICFHGKQVLQINPYLLAQSLRSHFEQYLAMLRRLPDSEEATCFCTFWTLINDDTIGKKSILMQGDTATSSVGTNAPGAVCESDQTYGNLILKKLI